MNYTKMKGNEGMNEFEKAVLEINVMLYLMEGVIEHYELTEMTDIDNLIYANRLMINLIRDKTNIFLTPRE